MNTSDFDYELPEELIAQHPICDRTSSRLLVLDKTTGITEEKKFKDIIEYFNPGDLLVLNDTRVIPARIYGKKNGSLIDVEVLLVKKISEDTWEALVKPGRRLKKDTKIFFSDSLKGKIIDVKPDGNRIIHFEYDGIFEEILNDVGVMPLPPYIKEKLDDDERYQTVYSREKGSVAAPTAGLHFDKELLNKIQEKGVNIAYVTLHVGIGTFRPVKVDNVLDHKMHTEYCTIPLETAKIINDTKKNGNKVIAVGTTTVRTLETFSKENGEVIANSGETNIFIYPGYEYKVVDSLITNFHLPKSTLLMLVSALAGKENILNAYNEAIKKRFRFFSFGDAMFIK